MAEIRAHMASFPARAEKLERAVASIAAQVDRVILVLNEYDALPGWLAKYPNVEASLATEDWKDVGKFVSTPAPDDWVFLCDDDMRYRPGFVRYMLAMAGEFDADKNVFALQARLHTQEVEGQPEKLHRYYYRKPVRRAIIVDQVATNSVLALGRNIAPLEYMRGSQKFVDVRYSRWCFEKGLRLLSIARPVNMMQPLKSRGAPTIYRDFTINTPDHVTREIAVYGGKVEGGGTRIGPKLSLAECLIPALALKKWGGR